MPLYIIYVLIWLAGFSINFPEIYWWNISSFEISRSSHPEVFFRKAVLKICSKFTEENPCRSVISITLLENTFRHGCSPVNLLHISRIPFPKNTSGRPLLYLATWLVSVTSFPRGKIDPTTLLFHSRWHWLKYSNEIRSLHYVWYNPWQFLIRANVHTLKKIGSKNSSVFQKLH